MARRGGILISVILVLTVILIGLRIHKFKSYETAQDVIGEDGRPLTKRQFLQQLRRHPAPFSDEPLAALRRNNTDHTKITLEMAMSGNAPRAVRVFADGIFDLFHQGHARMLMHAKTLFPNVYLIAGVCGDKDTHQKKGPTVMTDKERYEAVRHNRYVDEVVRNSPWAVNDEFVKFYKIDFVAHDNQEVPPDPSKDVYSLVKSRSIFVETKRTGGVSTSDLVRRIIQNFNVYVKRNLAQGHSEKELNVKFSPENGGYVPINKNSKEEDEEEGQQQQKEPRVKTKKKDS